MAKVTFILSVICIVTKHCVTEDTGLPKLLDLDLPNLDDLIASQKESSRQNQAGAAQSSVDQIPTSNGKDDSGTSSPLGNHPQLNLFNHSDPKSRPDVDLLIKPESTNNNNQEMPGQFEGDLNQVTDQAQRTSQENQDADLADITSLLQSSSEAGKDTHSFTPKSTRIPIVDGDAEEDEWFNNFDNEDDENDGISREMDVPSDNDDEDDEYDFAQWNNSDDDNADWDENNDDFAETHNNFVEGVVDEELARKNKQPTAPTSMVLFYTWMIVAILIVVVGVSTYRAHCKGMLFGRRTSASGDDRKRLLDHEFV